MTEVTPKDIIAGAINILETKGWTQGEYARDKDGDFVLTTDLEAACFCTLGALKVTAAGLGVEFPCGQVYTEARLAIMQTADIDHIPTWNDSPRQTKENVIATLRQALEIV